jgi:ribosome-binding protein aMBF1 (putative translation factor)
MTHATMKMDGKTFVLVPRGEYRRLVQDREPEMPTLRDDGTYPALPAVRISIARTIIRRRKSAGMMQKALAEAAGIRVETLNRIEKAKVTADTATIAKIERAFKRAGV